MSKETKRLAFGPVPSRRLGKSLGINNIPPKICSYSCIYCQLGKTDNLQINRQKFYGTDEIFDEVEKKIRQANEKNEKIDYLTFVSDGEPTLDINIGKEIKKLKKLKHKIAVITNASLLWDKKVQDDLLKADCVSIKIDAIDKKIWRRINRPHKLLKIEKILSGIIDFSEKFQGDLLTETMVIKNVNNDVNQFEKTAYFIKDLKPKKSYISIPIRPPAEKNIKIPVELDMIIFYNVFKERNINVELLTGYEENSFAFTGNVEEDLLSITSVHPMREESVDDFLFKAKSDWSVVKKLIDDKKLVEKIYKKNKFYMRKLK